MGVVVALAVVAFFVFSKKGTSGPGGDVSGSPSASGFQFVDAKAVAVTTVAGADQKKANKAALPTASQITQQMNTLYGEGFLGQGNWQQGKYDTALAVFDTGALAQAQRQIEVLTAGVAAGSKYSSIKADQSTLKIEVLLDKHNTAMAAVAIVKFSVIATGKDGSSVTLSSQGQFVFHQVGSMWKIESFKVDRDDTQVAASSSASATP